MAPTPTPERTDAVPFLDAQGAIERLGGLATVHARACALFARDALGLAQQVEAAVAAGELGLAARKAHELKGSSGWVGALRVQRLAADCEVACQAGQPAAEVAQALGLAVAGTIAAIAARQQDAALPA